MKNPKLPNSLRKFLRTEKARIRRSILDKNGSAQSIKELMLKVRAGHGKPVVKDSSPANPL